MTLQAIVDADGRGPRRRVRAGEPLDLGRGKAGRRRRARGCPLAGAIAQCLPADRVILEVALVVQAVAERHVHHAEGQGGVGARQRGQVPVGLLGRPRPVGIHRHQGGPAPARLLDERPEVDVRADDVRAPGHDETGVDDGLGIEADRLPHRGLEPGPSRAGADRPREEARPQRLEEPAVHASVREQAHVARVGIRKDGLRPVGGDDLAEALRDGAEGFVPGDPRESALAFLADAFQRMQDAVGAVDALEVAVHLGAQEPLGEAMLGVAAEGHRPALVDRHRHHAGVRAVVGAHHLVDAGVCHSVIDPPPYPSRYIGMRRSFCGPNSAAAFRCIAPRRGRGMLFREWLRLLINPPP